MELLTHQNGQKEKHWLITSGGENVVQWELSLVTGGHVDCHKRLRKQFGITWQSSRCACPPSTLRSHAYLLSRETLAHVQVHGEISMSRATLFVTAKYYKQ